MNSFYPHIIHTFFQLRVYKSPQTEENYVPKISLSTNLVLKIGSILLILIKCTVKVRESRVIQNCSKYVLIRNSVTWSPKSVASEYFHRAEKCFNPSLYLLFKYNINKAYI